MSDDQGRENRLDLSEEDKEIFQDFITESRESLEEIEPLLIELEESAEALDSVDTELINKIFRAFHSIKGSAGFLGLRLTGDITHQAETVLDAIRKGKSKLRIDHIDILLQLSDFFLEMLHHLSATYSEKEFEERGEEFIERLRRLGDGETTPPADAPPTEPGDETEELITPDMVSQFVADANETLDELEAALLRLEKNPTEREFIETAFRALHNLKGNSGFLGLKDIHEICHRAETFLDQVRNGRIAPAPDHYSLLTDLIDFLRQALNDLARGGTGSIAEKSGIFSMIDDFLLAGVGEDQATEQADVPARPEPPATAESPPAPPSGSAKAASPAAKAAAGASPARQKSPVSEAIRVDVDKLNTLMDLVGEIVIAESMVSQHPDIVGRDMPDFERAVLHLQKNIRELQELATSMRMIPLTGLFRKMLRLVRDLSKKSGKKAELEIIGGETEVDKSVIEHISDPLVHIIRNAMDHGIESAEERRAAGKPATARITLEANQVGGEIWITVSDDGRGLDRKKIIAKAIEKKLIDGDAADLPDPQVWRLIFTPGFSTASQVTDISGRGVGMDVVVRNIEKIRGRVDIFSEPGAGTRVVLRIPLTTAIIDGMLVRVQDSLYAIPMLDIRESLQIHAQDITRLADGQEVVRIREQLYPVVRLHDFYDLSPEAPPLADGILILVENGGKSLCLFVDELIGQKQLVIKPVPKYLGHIQGVSGCAILGNGEISLILDIASVINIAENQEKLQEFNYAI